MDNSKIGCGFIGTVTKMIFDILKAPQIFSVLLGHKASLGRVRRELHSLAGVESTASTEFCQGRTMRWGLAWTFQPSLQLERVTSAKARQDRARPFSFQLAAGPGLKTALEVFRTATACLQQIGVAVAVGKEGDQECCARLEAATPVWQHQRKKRRADKRKMLHQGVEMIPAKRLQGGEAELANVVDNVGGSSEVDLVSEQQENEMKDSDESVFTRSKQASSESGENPTSQQSATGSGLGDGSSEPVLVCDLLVRRAGTALSLDLSYVSGTGGRDAVSQLSQFIKNKLIQPS